MNKYILILALSTLIISCTSKDPETRRANVLKELTKDNPLALPPIFNERPERPKKEHAKKSLKITDKEEDSNATKNN